MYILDVILSSNLSAQRKASLITDTWRSVKPLFGLTLQKLTTDVAAIFTDKHPDFSFTHEVTNNVGSIMAVQPTQTYRQAPDEELLQQTIHKGFNKLNKYLVSYGFLPVGVKTRDLLLHCIAHKTKQSTNCILLAKQGCNLLIQHLYDPHDLVVARTFELTKPFSFIEKDFAFHSELK